MVKNEVSIVRVKEGLIEEAVRRAIDLMGGIKRTIKRHDRVFIKPNAVVPLSYSTGVVTNPAVIKALKLLEAGSH